MTTATGAHATPGRTPTSPNRSESASESATAATAAPWWRAPAAVWLLVLGLAFNMFSGHSDKMGLPIGLDRILLPAAVLLAVLDRRDRWWRLRSSHVVMALLAVIATASYLAVPHNINMQSFFTLLDRIYLPFLLFALAPYFLGTPARRGLFLRALTLMGAYLTFTTLAEVAGLNFLLFPRYIAAQQQANVGALAETGDIERAGGPFLFGEPNGMVLAMCAFAALHLATRTRGAWRMLALVVAPLALLTSVSTMTRAVWLGAALGIVLVACTRWAWIKWLPVIALLALLGLATAALIFPELAADAATRATTSRSLWDRVTTNNAAMAIMLDRPLTGVGWQQFVAEVPHYARQADLVPLATTNIEVHNVFLARGAELGLPGFFGFILVILLGPIAALCRPVRSDLIGWQLLLLAVTAVWLTVSMTSPNPYPLPAFLMWIVAGFVGALPPRGSPSPPARHA